MIVSIGTDLVEHQTSEKLNWKNDVNTLKRIFSSEEIQLFLNEKCVKFLSGRFAAKEAILKCLFTGMEDGISLTDIQILRLANGKPIIKLSGKPLQLSQNLGIKKWHISLTHSPHFSQAFIIAES
ncbi:holo-ACP synthase [Pseudopedobacter beijingensis]|uniref:Holo-[acyl-carrier-protein] synthase n=1 Tax=Pseudopedobacter beijingensis TaxID=1207056 RepID=A0ABW4IGE9_9SPHI